MKIASGQFQKMTLLIVIAILGERRSHGMRNQSVKEKIEIALTPKVEGKHKE